MLADLLDFYLLYKQLNIDIIYCGPLWADGIEGISDALRKRLDFDGLPLAAAQAVFSVFVEQMNNMLMYSADLHPRRSADNSISRYSGGIFILGSKNKIYFTQSGNPIPNDNIPPLKQRIDFLNTLSKSELREFYREQIRSNNTNPDSKGAGLGLIEIARRASSKIDYLFTPIDNNNSFFSMYVTVG